jgi:hypothetical protein
MREMEEWNSVSVGSPVGQNEAANTHWLSRANQYESRTRVSDGPKKRWFTGLGKDRGKVYECGGRCENLKSYITEAWSIQLDLREGFRGVTWKTGKFLTT